MCESKISEIKSLFQEIERDCKWLMNESGLTFLDRAACSLENMIEISGQMIIEFNKKGLDDFTYDFRDIEFLLYDPDHMDRVNHTKNIITNLDKVMVLNAAN